MCAVRILVLAGIVLAGSVAVGADDPSADEQVLAKAGIPSKGPDVLEFFRRRTLSEADQTRLVETVRRLGDPSFAVREKASADLLAAGRSALPFVRPARKDADLEIARRAEQCVRALESGAQTAVTLAAARLLAVRQPDGAAAAVLNYLPFADDESIEEELVSTLRQVGLRDGKADPALLAALKDRVLIRRAAAGFVLGRSANAEHRAAVQPLLTDTEPRVRLRTAQGLLAGKDREGVATLIALLSEAPTVVAWQAEEMLGRLAGEQTPAVALGAGGEAERRKCREAWESWWREQGAKLDLDGIDLDRRSLGLTLYVVYDGYGGGGRVWEVGPDGKTRWQIDNVGAIDAVVLPGNRVLLAEYNGRRVTERDFEGNVHWEHRVGNYPVACQRLPNGNTFIATFDELLEVTSAGKTVFAHKVGQDKICSALKLPTGQMIYLTYHGMVTVLDPQGKQGKSFDFKVSSRKSSLEALPGGRFLIPHPTAGKILTFDSAGQELWQCAVTRPTCATLLPNGNLLVCSADDKRVVEVDRAGNVIREQRVEGRPFRVRRR